MPVCHLNNVDMYYVEKGQGEPLLFLNGLAGDSMAWMGQLKTFGRRFRCIAIDQRDVGQSSYAQSPYTLADLARDCLEFCEQLHLPRVHIVGVSMGGMVAQEIALQAPERVASLALVNTLARVDDWFRSTLKLFDMVRRQSADTATFFGHLLPWWVSHSFFRDSGRTSWLLWLLAQNPYAQKLEGFLRQLQAVAGHDATSRLGSIRCPTLILTSEDDYIIPPRYSIELKHLIPAASLEQIAAVGHALPVENPVLFNQSIAKHLGNLARPDRQAG